MITLPNHRKGKDYYNHNYKPTTNTNKRCTKCKKVERRNKAYYCTVLNKFITANYICDHFSQKPKRVNKITNKGCC